MVDIHEDMFKGKAYEMGKSANLKSDNPFPRGTKKYHQFVNGWNHRHGGIPYNFGF